MFPLTVFTFCGSRGDIYVLHTVSMSQTLLFVLFHAAILMAFVFLRKGRDVDTTVLYALVMILFSI